LRFRFQFLNQCVSALRSLCRPRWSQPGHSEGRLMASIRKHRNKWQVQVRRAGHPHASRSFNQKADAKAWARQVEHKIDGGELVADLGVLNRSLVRDLLIRYRDTITPSKRGAVQEYSKIGLFLRHSIAGCSLRGLTPSVIAHYRVERLQIVRPSTVLRELAILRHCIEVASREWDNCQEISTTFSKCC